MENWLNILTKSRYLNLIVISLSQFTTYPTIQILILIPFLIKRWGVWNIYVQQSNWSHHKLFTLNVQKNDVYISCMSIFVIMKSSVSVHRIVFLIHMWGIVCVWEKCSCVVLNQVSIKITENKIKCYLWLVKEEKVETIVYGWCLGDDPKTDWR